MTSEHRLRRGTPEAEGVPSTAIMDFVRAVERHTHPLDAVQSFMLLRHGSVVAEGWWTPYGPAYPHTFFSLSKSFTSTGIGFAVAEGLLTVDDPVLGFFPDEAPADPSENLRAMRVRHLLTMNTGHQEDTTERVIIRGENDNWAQAFLSLPVEHRPGTWFVYNTTATYMLSAIITKLTGKTLLDYLRPRLLDPLGIERATWDVDPRGINVGGSGLHARTEDIARFGQLFLQKGEWNGKRIVSEEWIAEATRAHSDNRNTQTNPDWTVGYGYQFWRCRHGCYRGDGAFGQFCVVMPEQDAVLAITGGLRDMQTVLDQVWEHLLPAMRSNALPPNSEAFRALEEKLGSLTLPLPEGSATSPHADRWSEGAYRMDHNDLGIERVELSFALDGAMLTTVDGTGDHSLTVGHGAWLRGTTDVLRRGVQPVAASGAWTASDIYEARVCLYESEFCPVLRFSFGDGVLRLDIDPNVAWGTPAVTTLTGHVVG